MRTIFRLLFAIGCFLGTIGYIRVLVALIARQLATPELYFTFGLGCIVYTLLWLVFFSRRSRFWSVVAHELTHALFAIFFFKKVHSFAADQEGGRIEIEGENFMIALAPYFFPLLSLILVVIKPSVLDRYQWILNGFLGFSLMFHLLNLTTEFHPAQPDLRQNGILFSLIVVLFFNVFFTGVCLASLTGEWAIIWQFVRDGAQASMGLLSLKLPL